MTPDLRNLGALRRRDILRGAAAFGLTGAAWGGAAPGLAAPRQERPPAVVYTEGHYAPVRVEQVAQRLEVSGAIPPELAGRYFRNGHNPPVGQAPRFWFEGSGMIHGVRLKNGRAEWYRNSWVRTPALTGAKTFHEDGSVDLTASAAATSVYAHAGRIYALQEVNLPFLVGPELQTLGSFNFGGKLDRAMTAHPYVDPRTGEMLFMSYGAQEPHLVYYRVSPEGDLTHIEAVAGAGPSIMHDFAATPNWVLFLDPSVVFDPKSKLPFPYVWNETYQAKIGVMPRDRAKGPVRWIPVDPFFYFHISNAWEEADGTLRLEATYYDGDAWTRFSTWLMSLPAHGPYVVDGARLARFRIDPVAGGAQVELRSTINADFPNINPRLAGLKNRYTYAAAFPHAGLRRHALVKYDAGTGDAALREFPDGVMPGEPWFVPASQGDAEDDGWLFTLVSDLRTKRGALHILDATNIRAAPVAVIEIPGWVAAGVHGSWISDAELQL